MSGNPRASTLVVAITVAFLAGACTTGVISSSLRDKFFACPHSRP
jgi:hypothetical protein